MRIVVRRPGYGTGEWPAEWPAPMIGDTVTYPDGTTWTVREVVWYPEGTGETDPGAPFVYVVLRKAGQ